MPQSERIPFRWVLGIAILIMAATCVFGACTPLRSGRFMLSVLNRSPDKIQVYVASVLQDPVLEPSGSHLYEARVFCKDPSPGSYDPTSPDYCHQQFSVHAVNLRTKIASKPKNVSGDESRIAQITFSASDFK